MHLAIILLIKSTFLLSLAILLLLACRRTSASLRHWIISLTLIGLLVLPLCTYFLPNLEVEIPYYKELSINEQVSKRPTNFSEALPLEKEMIQNRNMEVHKNDPIPLKEDSINLSESFSFSNLELGPILIGLWLLGCLIGLGRLLFGIFKIYRISKTSTKFDSPHSANKKVVILVNKEIQTPMTWGFKEGIILLPEAAKQWSTETLETVIVHELAHIQRKDYWVHILSLISACLYWFHPMIWWMKKRQILEREKACDEYVLSAGLANQTYAQQLISVARNLSSIAKSQEHYALPMAATSQLKQRIIAILKFQKERFRFTAIRQWQWATFFVSLIFLLSAFTPVEKSGIVERLLEELPALTPSKLAPLKVKHHRSINPIIPLPHSKRTVENTLPVMATSTEEVIKPLPTKLSNLQWEALPINTESISASHFTKLDLKEQKSSIKGKFGTWTDKNNQFQIATYGNYRTISVFPYVEVEDAESMVIIKHNKGYRKQYCLVITKAPYDGRIVQNYKNGKPNSWSGNYRKNDIVYLWTVDKRWEFLGDQNRDKWMAKRMDKIRTKLTQSDFLKPANEKDFFWQQLVQSQQHLKERHFVANNLLFEEDSRFDWVATPTPSINWEAIPYQATRPLKPIDKWGKIGNSLVLTSTTSASCPARKGLKFGKVFRNMPHSILKSFNFKIHTNQHKRIDFKLHLYQLVNGELSHRILSTPIESGTVENSKKGWVRMELSQDKIYAEGDILAIIEVDHKTRKKWGCLALNHGVGLYNVTKKKYSFDGLDFFNENFAFYFTVQQ